jgi:hypothetical protein
VHIWAKYFCQLVSLQFGSKLNLYVQYSKIEIYLEIRGCDNLSTAEIWTSKGTFSKKYLQWHTFEEYDIVEVLTKFGARLNLSHHFSIPI